MSDTAAHLVDRVLPDVPVRQWVLSVPHALRYRLAYDATLVGQVFGIFARVVFQLLRRKAREYGIPNGQCGAVTFVQRFGSSVNLHVHAHMLVLDGVYAALEGEAPRFYALHAPEEEEVAWVVAQVAERTAALLKRLGESGPDGDEDRLSRDDPWLAELYAAGVRGAVATGARAGRRVQTAGPERNPADDPGPAGPRCANAAGFSVHANVAIGEHRRDQLERLCRYMCRPPLAVDRLGHLPDGRLTYRMKTPWHNGTTHVIFSPSEFLEKLAVLVPAPRVHLVRFYGVLGPAAKWRPQVVPVASERSAGNVTGSEAVCIHTQEPEKKVETRKRRNYAWAELMKRVWAIDVLECPRCCGRMRLVAAIHAQDALRRILECLGLPSRAPPVRPARRSGIVCAEG
jgi:hypothetical protein